MKIFIDHIDLTAFRKPLDEWGNTYEVVSDENPRVEFHKPFWSFNIARLMGCSPYGLRDNDLPEKQSPNPFIFMDIRILIHERYHENLSSDSSPACRYFTIPVLIGMNFADTKLINWAQVIFAIREDRTILPNIVKEDFENLMAEVFRGNGYDEVIKTKKTHDGRVDLVLIKKLIGDKIQKTYVQCKTRLTQAARIGVATCRELMGVIKDKITAGIIATNVLFSKAAKKYIGENEYRLFGFDRDIILELVHNYVFPAHAAI